MKSLTPSELKVFLLAVAPIRPVFIWGAPGVGKTAMVNDFGAALGDQVVSLLGSQLAPEDLIGVPRLTTSPSGVALSEFAPPRAIAGHEQPFILFCDEFNASSPDVQKAFYSLVTEQRLGEYRLPAGSIVILAGNRAVDNAITRQVSSALMNRVVHVELRASSSDWLRWAATAGIHPYVMSYIGTRPDHLFSAPPKIEEPFSTPRSWHILSDALAGYREDELTPEVVGLLAEGTVSPNHARLFAALVRTKLSNFRIDKILDGSEALPLGPDQADLLVFIVQAVRAQLIRELPPTKDGLSASGRARLHQVRGLAGTLARHNRDMLPLLLARGDDERAYPDWFMAEMTAVLGKLAGSAGLAAEA